MRDGVSSTDNISRAKSAALTGRGSPPERLPCTKEEDLPSDRTGTNNGPSNLCEGREERRDGRNGRGHEDILERGENVRHPVFQLLPYRAQHATFSFAENIIF